MDRRDFLKRSALLTGALCLDFKAFAKATSTLGSPHLRVGILSDIHIRTEQNVPVLERTLQFYRDHEVDAVLIAGDMADHGLEKQMRLISECWFRVFPKDRLPNGKHVERLFVYGNHDIEGYSYGMGDEVLCGEDRDTLVKREAINPHKEQMWKKYWKEKFQPIYIKDVKGYKFVGAHWTNWKNTPGIQDFLKSHESELRGSKPFFYFQHPHPKGTTGGKWAWGQDNGEVTEALSNFPNCFCFSGHSHLVLNDERCVWQGAFTSIGTASLSYIIAIGGRENSRIDGGPGYPSQMPAINGGEGKQGMLMTVYDDTVALERWDFNYMKPLADNWLIPTSVSGKPFSFEKRAEKAPVPQFANGDKAYITRAEGKGADGKQQMLTTVHFPNVLKKRTGVRAFDFEVTEEQTREDLTLTVCQKHVFSSHMMNCEDKDEDEVTCVFGENEILKEFPFRFCIRPCESFGKKGNPIYTDWQTIK